MIGVFIAIYILLAAANVFVYVKRKSALAPILAIHQNRSDKISDFSASSEHATFINNKIRELNEEVIWADVSLRVPGIRDLFLAFFPIIFGFILLIVVTSLVAHAGAFSIVLLGLLSGPIAILIIGILQVFKGSHFTHINVLTPRGAHIITHGVPCVKSHFVPYHQMSNIHTSNISAGVGDVYFAETWELENVENTEARNGRLYTTEEKQWKKKGIGFTSVISPMEVQGIIISRQGGGGGGLDPPPYTPPPVYENPGVRYSGY